jgi:hypothetical protein
MALLSTEDTVRLQIILSALIPHAVGHASPCLEPDQAAQDIELWVSHVDEDTHEIYLQYMEARVNAERILIDTNGRPFVHLCVGGNYVDVFLLEEVAVVIATPCDQGHYGISECGKCHSILPDNPLPSRCPRCGVKLAGVSFNYPHGGSDF